MQVKKILSILDDIAPFDTAEKWDNVGLMVGDPDQDVSTIVIALDPSFEAISWARDVQADCIITHHPLFLQPIRCINLQEMIAKKISFLLNSNISVVSMHTNLDTALGGVADVFAQKLSLKDVVNRGILRMGTIQRGMTLASWVNTLPFKNIRIVDAHREVLQVCACPGSGMDLWKDAYDLGCDTYVTGDVRYHSALEALETGMNIVDIGHYGTEEIIVKPFMKKLQQQLPRVYIRAYEGRDVFMSTKESEA
jgi:dinuclear metal center YbgI/SA1388 family protein